MNRALSSAAARVGVFERLFQADAAVDALVREGFTRDEITVICPTCSPDAFTRRAEREEPAGAPAPKAAATGGAIGAVLGGLIALVGVTASGGVGLLAAGPFFAGAGGGAVAGGLIGAMLRRGFQRDVADYFDQALEKGNILVAVEPHGERDEVSLERLRVAERVLVHAGAHTLPLPQV